MGQGREGCAWLLAVLLLLAIGGCTAQVEPPADTTAEPATPAQQQMTEALALAAAEPERPEDARRLTGDPASRRYALVLGNGAYRHGDALSAPTRDAALMARALQGRGYHVLVGTDRDLAGMREDIAAFADMSRDAQLRLFYFAGHGFEIEGANYLMPVDLPASIEDLDARGVRTHALRLDQLVWELEQDAPVLVAVIDACRVPPVRGAGRVSALGAQDPPEGTILAYATAPGRVAMDSLRAYGIDEEHSPYTYYLADALAAPEVESWDQAFQTAYNIVNHRTRGAQQPWMNARVSRFPPIGPLAAQAAGGQGLAGFGPASVGMSPERRAAGKYWADEALAVLTLAADGSRTDAALQRLAGEGDARATLALATRRWDQGQQQAAIPMLQTLAEQGNAVAQTHLGTLLHELAAKDGAGRNARYWWAQASAQGVGEARAKLAIVDGNADQVFEEFMRGAMEHYEAFKPAVPEGAW